MTILDYSNSIVCEASKMNVGDSVEIDDVRCDIHTIVRKENRISVNTNRGSFSLHPSRLVRIWA